MKRAIIEINDDRCNGCGSCISNCHEGALQIIHGKAVLVSDLMCDGLGACIGHCPEDALTITEREAAPYDEEKVMIDMLAKGKHVVIAHLQHLKEHGEFEYLKQGVAYLNHNKLNINFKVQEVIDFVHKSSSDMKAIHTIHKPAPIMTSQNHHIESCPGSQSRTFTPINAKHVNIQDSPSSLTQWPIQMHLINPMSADFQGTDLLIAADCVAFSTGNFHTNFLKGKKLAIACPKLDTNKEIYIDKIIRFIDNAGIKSITVMMMEVPCCGGLLQLVLKASKSANRKVPVNAITIGIRGEILLETQPNC